MSEIDDLEEIVRSVTSDKANVSARRVRQGRKLLRNHSPGKTPRWVLQLRREKSWDDRRK